MKKKSIVISIVLLIIIILGVIVFLFRENFGGNNVGSVKIVNQSGVANELKGHKKGTTDVYDLLSDGLPIIAYTKNSVLSDIEKKLASDGGTVSAVTTLVTTSDEIQIQGRRSDNVPVIYSVYKQDGTFVSKDTVLNIPAENLRSKDKTDIYIIEIDVTWDEENEYLYYFKCNLT
ncbi:MAG: hypothetical protein LBL93_06480 [Ruminococcus sp.]|jgi:hypothetical protein|nr:hypothetical protein [Ruminococcus sp.]